MAARRFLPRAGLVLLVLALIACAVPAAGAVGVNCVPAAAAVTRPGQSVCFSADPTVGVPEVAADEQPAGNTTLLFSDDPEYVPGPGILYQDTVALSGGQAPQGFRVYLYHADPRRAAGPLYLGVVLTNNGSQPATVTLTRWAVGGPSTDYLLLGKHTVQKWLASAPAPVALTIAPGTSAFLDAGLPAPDRLEDQAVDPGQALNAIFDGTETAPVEVTVAANTAPIGSPNFISGISVLPSSRLAPGRQPMRGTFPHADEIGSYTLQATGHGQVVLHLADAGRYLTGYDALDSQSVVDYGNYGVLYHDTVSVSAPASGAPDRFALFVIPRGGNFTTAADLTAGLLAPAPVAGAPVPSDNRFLPPYTFGSVLDEYCLSPGATTTASLEWMPAAGSFLPVDLWEDPIAGPLSALPGAGACAPTLTSVSPGSGLAGTSVTLTGQGFGSTPGAVVVTPSGGSAVTLAGASGSWSATSASVALPANLAPGQVSVAVYSAWTGLTSHAIPFVVTPPPPPPALNAAAPGTVEPGGSVTLTGDGFGQAGAVDFRQGIGPLFTVSGGLWFAGSIRTLVPVGLAPGTVEVSVHNALTGLTSNAVTLAVTAPPKIGAVPAATGGVGAPFVLNLDATGGSSPYTWSLASGTLPPGIDLAPGSGRVAGTPTAAGTFDATVRVTDAAGGTGTAVLGITVSPAASPSRGAASAPAGTASSGSSAASAPGGTASSGSSAASAPGGTASSGSSAASAPGRTASSGSSAAPAPGGAASSGSSAASAAGAALSPSGTVSLTATPEQVAGPLAAATRSGTSYVVLRVSGRLPRSATVQVPPQTLAELGRARKGLTLGFGPAAFSLPGADLSGSASAGGASTLVLTLDATPAPRTAAASRSASLAAGAPPGASVRLAAPVVSFGLVLRGKKTIAVKLDRPAIARLAIDPGFSANPQLLACYRMGAKGGPAYVPSEVASTGSSTEACAIPEAGRYAVLWTQVSFADLAGSWAAGDVAIAAAHHVVDGVGPHTFSPGADVTRAEFSAMLARALGLAPDAAAARRFEDVSAGAWYAGAVGAVARAGLLEGIGPGLFDPMAPVTRQQAAVVLARALPWVGRPAAVAAAPRFTDSAAIAAWARKGVAAAAKAGLVQGFPNNSFKPHVVLDRAEAAAVFVRYLALGVPAA